MTPEEKSFIIERYNERLQSLGPTAQALGWRDQAQQHLRFRVLAEIADCTGQQVLDVGCGFGDLLDYLEHRRQKPALFTGTDLNPALIEVARAKHPGSVFITTAGLSSLPDESQDWVMISGLFNFRIEDNTAFLRNTVAESFRIARRGVAFNVLGSRVDFQEPHLFYHNEEDTFAFARTLSRFVTLRADYPLYEFTVYLFKQEPRNEEFACEIE